MKIYNFNIKNPYLHTWLKYQKDLDNQINSIMDWQAYFKTDWDIINGSNNWRTDEDQKDLTKNPTIENPYQQNLEIVHLYKTFLTLPRTVYPSELSTADIWNHWESYVSFDLLASFKAVPYGDITLYCTVFHESTQQGGTTHQCYWIKPWYRLTTNELTYIDDEEWFYQVWSETTDTNIIFERGITGGSSTWNALNERIGVLIPELGPDAPDQQIIQEESISTFNHTLLTYHEGFINLSSNNGFLTRNLEIQSIPAKQILSNENYILKKGSNKWIYITITDSNNPIIAELPLVRHDTWYLVPDFLVGYCCTYNVVEENAVIGSNSDERTLSDYLIYPLNNGGFYNWFYGNPTTASYIDNDILAFVDKTEFVLNKKPLRYLNWAADNNLRSSWIQYSLNSDILQSRTHTRWVNSPFVMPMCYWKEGDIILQSSLEGTHAVEEIFMDSNYSIVEYNDPTDKIRRAQLNLNFDKPNTCPNVKIRVI